MSEIEKMYILAGIRKGRMSDEDCAEYCLDYECKNCRYNNYPPFTAGKQLNILKIIVHSFGFNSLDKPIWDKGWDIAIAKLVNIYWEVLTEKEKQQVKGILE